MAFNWDISAVAMTLGCEPVFQDNSSYRFDFCHPVNNGTMTVYPYTGQVDLSIGVGEHQWAAWSLSNVEIIAQEDDEQPNEGEMFLTIKPLTGKDARNVSTHWIIISRNAANGGVEIRTVFHS